MSQLSGEEQELRLDSMKVGVIGCGMIARKAHLPVYRALGAEIVAVADLNERRARACAKKFKAAEWFQDYHDLLRKNLDLVSVCTPNESHARIAIDAAEAGKHILIEKPMATNLRDADEMIEVCRSSGVKLCPVHNWRLFPCVLEAKKRVSNGRIGSVVSISAIAHVLLPMHAGQRSSWFYHKWGLLEDFGTHMIDIINYICGSQPLDVKVVARDFTGFMDVLNHINATMLLENKACVNLDLSWITGCHEVSLKILGTAGTLFLDVRNDHIRETHGYSTPIEDLWDLRDRIFKVGQGVISKNYFRGALYHYRLIIKRFMECIIDETNPPITVEEARAVIEVMESIKHSYARAW